MKKIAILCDRINNIGGIDRVVNNLAKGLIELGYDIDILYIDEGKYKSKYNIDRNINYINIAGKNKIQYIKNIRNYIKNTQADGIISAGRYMNSLLIQAKLLTRTNIKTIVTEHSNAREYCETITNKVLKYKIKIATNIIKILYKYSDNVVAVSKTLKNVMKKDFRKLKISTIYNPVVDEELFSKSKEIIKEYPYIDNNIPIIVSVGRLSSDKNPVLLLDAFSKAINKIDMNLVFIGDGPLRDVLNQKIKSLGLENRVFIYGYKDNPYPYIKNADLFVLSSKTEAFGIVLIESLALGTNIVSTKCEGAPNELLNNGEFGIICEEDIDSLSNAIIKGLENDIVSDKYDEIIQYIEQFKTKNVANEYLKLLKSEFN